MKKFFAEEEFDGMSEMVCMAIDEHGWLCDDGHWLTAEELAQWTDEMFVEAFALIYVEYPVSTPKEPESVKPSAVTEVKAKGYAKSFNKSVAGTYTVTASSLNVRDGAGTDNKVLVAIPKGTKVRCYGYYTTINGVKWLYVQFTYKRVTYTGFCSGAYLKK